MAARSRKTSSIIRGVALAQAGFLKSLGPSLGIILAGAILATPVAKAMNRIGGGLSLTDQGDDIVRPSLSITTDWDQFFAVYHHYGRQFGPVRERHQIFGLGLTQNWFAPAVVDLKARFGISVLREYTKISHSSASGSEQESQYALGGILGVAAEKAFSQCYLQLFWDSYLYPAGVNGGILLATGRKQIIGFIIGWSRI